MYYSCTTPCTQLVVVAVQYTSKSLIAIHSRFDAHEHQVGIELYRICFMGIKVECIFFVAHGFIMHTRMIKQSWHTRHVPHENTLICWVVAALVMDNA